MHSASISAANPKIPKKKDDASEMRFTGLMIAVIRAISLKSASRQISANKGTVSTIVKINVRWVIRNVPVVWFNSAPAMSKPDVPNGVHLSHVKAKKSAKTEPV